MCYRNARGTLYARYRRTARIDYRSNAARRSGYGATCRNNFRTARNCNVARICGATSCTADFVASATCWIFLRTRFLAIAGGDFFGDVVKIYSRSRVRAAGVHC